MYYLNARYYNPKVGRFITRDVIYDTNLYLYSGNNPVMFVDPSGYDQAAVGCYGGGSSKVTPEVIPDDDWIQTPNETPSDNPNNNPYQSNPNNTVDNTATDGVMKIFSTTADIAIDKKIVDAAADISKKSLKVVAKVTRHIPGVGLAVGTALDVGEYGLGGAIKKNLINTGVELAIVGAVVLAGASAPVVGLVGIGVAIGSAVLDLGYNWRPSSLFGL